MSEAIPPLPNTPQWRGAQLKHRDFTSISIGHLQTIRGYEHMQGCEPNFFFPRAFPQISQVHSTTGNTA
jgi:hypothetical protein